MNKLLKIICKDLKNAMPVFLLIVLWCFLFAITVVTYFSLFSNLDNSRDISAVVTLTLPTALSAWIYSIYYRLKEDKK
jgi:hypothetical protein